jgi:hypothetical protein
LSSNRYVLIFFNRAETSTAFTLSLQRPEFRGLKVVGIRDVVEHTDVEVPSGTLFKTKIVKRHAVANYVFTLGAKEDSILTE